MDPISAAFSKIIGAMLSAIVGTITPQPSQPSNPAHSARPVAPDAPKAPSHKNADSPSR